MSASEADVEVPNGTRRIIDGKECVFYEGYWIRYYAPPPESPDARKRLLLELSRRLFHHTEAGINTPSEKLELAREAYECETDPARRRVNAAMLAGALFNRATALFTEIVEVQRKGGRVSPDNELLRQCEQYFTEALELGRQVRHYSGEEGIDELWGEPLKVFALPLREYYETRYLKIAQTMHEIDRAAARLLTALAPERPFAGVEPLIDDFARAARLETETMRSDPVIFRIWPRFVAARDALGAFRPCLPASAGDAAVRRVETGRGLLRRYADLLTYLAGARVPMPKTTADFLERCETFAARGRRRPSPARAASR